MLTIRKLGPGAGAAVEDCAQAAPPAAAQITIAVRAAGICGSDVHAWAWDAGYDFMTPHLPLTLGHEFAGHVVALGEGVDHLALGDAVVCWPTITCGTCASCRAGSPGDCAQRRVIGLHRDGGFASHVTLPAANALPLPAGLPMDVAALAEPLAVAVHAVDLAEPGFGTKIMVMGPGMIGLCAALVAQDRGADVLLAGHGDQPRLDLARRMGIRRTLDLATDGAAATLDGFAPLDAVIEATGNPATIDQGLSLLRQGGIMVVAGIHGGPVTFDINRLVRGKKQLRGSHDTTPRAFREAIGRLAADPDRFAPLITHRLPLSRAEEGFALARQRSALKVLLIPEESPDA